MEKWDEDEYRKSGDYFLSKVVLDLSFYIKDKPPSYRTNGFIDVPNRLGPCSHPHPVLPLLPSHNVPL